MYISLSNGFFSTDTYNFTCGIIITMLAIFGTAANILSGIIYCKNEMRNHHIGLVQISLRTRSSLYIGNIFYYLTGYDTYWKITEIVVTYCEKKLV